ncbi:hypothetical protein [Hymenobacter koreensis]
MKKRLRKKLYRKEYSDPRVRSKLHVMLAPMTEELMALLASRTQSD